MTVLRIADRRRENLGDCHGAVIAQQHHPALECAGHDRGQKPGARDQIEAEALVMRDGRGGGRDALAAEHLRLAALGVVENGGHVAARTVQMRFDDLQGEGCRHRGIERIAAPLQNPHADGGRDPMRRRDHAERALDFRPRGEGVGIDIGHKCSLVVFGHVAAFGIKVPAIGRGAWSCSACCVGRARRLKTDRMYPAACGAARVEKVGRGKRNRDKANR